MSSRASIDQFLRRVESGEYFERLVNQPSPHRLRATPALVYHSTLHDLEPRLTVVTPTFKATSRYASGATTPCSCGCWRAARRPRRYPDAAVTRSCTCAVPRSVGGSSRRRISSASADERSTRPTASTP